MRHSPVPAFEQGTIPISQSGWTTFAPASPTYSALEADQTADVVVIGAVLAGASERV